MTILLEAPTEIDLTVYKGNDYSKTFELKDSSGVAIDLTGWSAKSQVRTRNKRAATLTVEFTATISTPETDGEVVISLTDTQTGAITRSSGYWDLMLTDDADFDEIYVFGTVDFEGTVTEK